MTVKLAAQVLSNTVAAILKIVADKYGYSVKAKEILETAQIVESTFDFSITPMVPRPEKTIRNRR